MSKHTPGPWNILPLEGKYYGAEIEIGEYSIKVWTPDYLASPFASVREIANGWEPENGHDHVEDVRSYANACLISAAPELLAVLEELSECADYWGEYDVPFGIVDRIKSVLMKARGEK